MSVTVETLEKNMAKLTITVSADEIEKAMQAVYQKNRSRYSVPGFRKGKVSRSVLERMYGKGLFYEDAVNSVMPEAYEKAVEESGLDIVSEPDIKFVETDPEKDLVFTAEVAVKPEVVLGEYRGVEVPKADLTVTEDEVLAIIKKEQEKNAVNVNVEGRAVQSGDIATIDFEGFVDGAAFEGGKGEDYPLTIGSNTFIPGFEDQIIGHEIGTEFDVNVTFPEDYQAEELKGKAAVFKVTVKKIEEKQLPELDDEFAAEVSEFETMAEYKAHVEKAETERKEAAAEQAKEEAAIQKAVDNAQMDIPDAMVATEANNMIREFASNLERQGLKLDQYLEYFGQTQDGMREQMKPNALKRIQTRLVLEAIAKAEAFEISEDEINAEIKSMAEQYQMEEDQVKTMVNMEYLKEDISYKKASQLLVDEAKEV
ncbi:MAG: trigger factor [Lachnospiraceae bacterium]|nr:trigger factor [Lachnospiraceae bacterium]